MTNPAWTYSRLDKFETCPKQFYETKVAMNYVEPPTEATLWGERVHSAFEALLLHGTPMPEGMTQWQGLASKFAALPGKKFVEHKFALAHSLQPTEWKTAWSRGIADLVVKYKTTVLIVDWKTGKKKPTEQLDLYAAYAKAYWPDIQTIKTSFVWLREKKFTNNTIAADSGVPIIWQEFMPRVRRMERAYQENKWPAKPSGLCNGWCPVKSCAYYKEKK